MKCKSKVGLKIHISKKHQNIPQLDGNSDEDLLKHEVNEFKCEWCEFVGKNNELLELHTKNKQHGNYRCDECGYKCNSNTYMCKSCCSLGKLVNDI